MNKLYNSRWVALGVILLLFVLGWWQELLQLESVNFTGGDGGKNQFAFLDYVLRGNGLMTYGMNYPYGEHITFTDNQPPIAILVKFIHDYIIDIENNVLAIHNFWVLFQIPLGAICFYFLLRNVLEQPLFALMGALLIVYLSPQLVRLHTHFSLGYMFVYGAAFNCLWLILVRNKEKYAALALFFIAFIGGFSHLYNFIGVLLFAGAILFLALLNKRLHWKQFLYISVPLGLAGIFIIYLVQGLDPFLMRPQTAEGLFHFSATFEGTIYPYFGQEAHWFHTMLPGIYEPNWEGRNFVGFVALGLNMLFFIFYFKNKTFRRNQVKTLLLFWIAAFLVWLYACEVFFAPFDKSFILSLPYISQFRSIGRFAVVFYYIVGTTGIFMLAHLWTIKKNGLKVIVALLVILWGTESYFNQAGIKLNKQITMEDALYSSNYFNMDSVLNSYNRDISDYQCAIILPISTSCNFGSEVGQKTIHLGSRLRMETGLPLINSVYTRGDITHGIGVAQLLSTYPSEKRLLKNLNNKKLLIQYPTDTTLLTKEDNKLIAAATFIGSAKNCFLAEITTEEIAALKDKVNKKELLLEKANIIPLVKKEIDKTTYALATYIRTDTTMGLRIKFKTSMAPHYAIAKYKFELEDKQGNKLWELPVYFNNFDFDGLYNIKSDNYKRSALRGVHSLRLVTDKKDEKTTELSIYPIESSE